MKPIRLLWLVVLVALAWSAWWGWGAWHAKSDLTAWLEERRAAGWQAEWSDIEVKGYPTRIDRTITNLTLANTDGGWVWSAPFFQILGLNYAKDHVILVWPDTMQLQTPYERISITGKDLKGSLTFVPGTDQELEEGTLVFKGLKMVSDAGWTSSVAEARVATRPVAGLDGPRDVGIDIIGLTPRAPVIQHLAKAGLVPATVDTLKADLAVTFDQPWTRAAVERERPQPRDIEIREIAAKWGQLELRFAGDVTVSDSGRIAGEVMVKATNWQEILTVARQSGALPDAVFDPLQTALTLISSLAGSSKTLDIPLVFESGRTWIGPVPVGAAPTLRLP